MRSAFSPPNHPIMLLVVALAVVFSLSAVALLGVRLLLVKGSSFRGTCAGNSLYLQNEGVACGVCGRKPGEACGQPTADLPPVGATLGIKKSGRGVGR